jgi:probable DNA metabolism protein
VMEHMADMNVKLAGHTDLAGFRSEARQLLAHQVPPDEVHWLLELQGDQYIDAQSPQASRPRNVARAATAIVPASFTRLCEFVVLHRDPERFSLLYRLLWRLVHEPNLRNDPVDADMLQAQHMAHAVRRDIHKMKANLRLHAIRDAQGLPLEVGCYEPAHHVLEAVAPWFAKRLTAPRWALFTPERSVRGEDGRLMFGPGVPSGDLPGNDGTEAQWLACYERVFAPHDRPAAHA